MRRSRSSQLPLLALLAATAVAPACSGAPPSILDGPGGDDAGSSSGDDGGGSGGSSSGGGSGGASSSGSGGGTGDSGKRDGSSSGGGGGDAAADAAQDAGPLPSVLCPANDSSMKCDPGNYCCVTGTSASGDQTDVCKTSSQSCGGTPVRCAVPSDCPKGDVCCGTEQEVSEVYHYVDVSCAKTCSASLEITFCHASGDCPSTAPTCGPSGLMPGYTVCQQ